MFSAIGPAVITKYLPPSVRGKSLGFLIAMSAAGYALGPGIGGFVSQYRRLALGLLPQPPDRACRTYHELVMPAISFQVPPDKNP